MLLPPEKVLVAEVPSRVRRKNCLSRRLKQLKLMALPMMMPSQENLPGEEKILSKERRKNCLLKLHILPKRVMN